MPPGINYLLYVLWLIACALPAALLARAGALAFGLDGLGAALATVIVAMALAVLFFGLSVWLGRVLHLIR